MKRILIVTAATALLHFSCNDDNGGSTLQVSTHDIALDAEGLAQTLVVTTGDPLWDVANETAWVKIEREGTGNVLVGAYTNTKKQPRSAKIVICAGGRYERINITQEASLRSIGDAWPDAANPTGVVYKMSAGGAHGTVVSLDQLQCAWGPAGTTTHPGATGEFRNGKAATRAIIEAHRNDADFATAYPAYYWVYLKNGSNLDGEWYIPAYFQLVELHRTTTGNVYTIPATGNPPMMHNDASVRVTQDAAARDAFNASITAAGGTPVTYAAGIHWSSSEASAGQACLVVFNSGNYYGSYTMVNTNKGSSVYVRAVREF